MLFQTVLQFVKEIAWGKMGAIGLTERIESSFQHIKKYASGGMVFAQENGFGSF